MLSTITSLGRWLLGDDSLGGPVLADGWSDCGPGAVWSTGDASVLHLPAARAAGDLLLQITLMPYVRKPARPAQRLIVEVNGRPVGSDELCCKTIVAYRLPAAIFGRPDALSVRLLHPGAISPRDAEAASDTRRLGFAVWEILLLDVPPEPPFTPFRTAPAGQIDPAALPAQIGRAEATFGMSIGDIAMAFESLGTNCEFGLVQRRCACEPLSLLRFAGMPYPNLVEGLDLGFPDIADPQYLACDIAGLKPEWMVRHAGYDMAFHTFIPPDGITPAELLANQSRLLAFRRDRLLELLATGEKIFVVMRPEGLTASQALPLLTILRSYGPNALLFVTHMSGEPAGSVVALAPDFFCGSLDGVARLEADPARAAQDTWLSDTAFSAWLAICAATLFLWKNGRPPALP